MKVICERSYMCEIKKEIIFTNKKKYDYALPEDENEIIFIWILDNNNEWVFFTKKTFLKHFETLEIHRNKKINEILN
jgi:hypothetical protein